MKLSKTLSTLSLAAAVLGGAILTPSAHAARSDLGRLGDHDGVMDKKDKQKSRKKGKGRGLGGSGSFAPGKGKGGGANVPTPNPGGSKKGG
ncbi:MAG: hypothetical protein ABI036_16130 [Fibrobacteria bacterium]